MYAYQSHVLARVVRVTVTRSLISPISRSYSPVTSNLVKSAIQPLRARFAFPLFQPKIAGSVHYNCSMPARREAARRESEMPASQLPAKRNASGMIGTCVQSLLRDANALM